MNFWKNKSKTIEKTFDKKVVLIDNNKEKKYEKKKQSKITKEEQAKCTYLTELR